MKSSVILNQDVQTEDLGDGVTRKVLAWLPAQMVVEVRFETGAMGTLHSHPHTQCTYVLNGEFEFTLGGERVTVTKGDTIAFAPHEVHSCLCKQKGALVDVFTPMREDFLK